MQVASCGHAEFDKVNADFIVRAVNSHDALVAALERALPELPSFALNQARAALALAKKEG